MIDPPEPRRSVTRGEPIDLLARIDRQADLRRGLAERSRPGQDPADMSDDDVPLRLAMWLADVGAEAALAARSREGHAGSPSPGPAERRPVAGPAT